MVDVRWHMGEESIRCAQCAGVSSAEVYDIVFLPSILACVTGPSRLDSTQFRPLCLKLLEAGASMRLDTSYVHRHQETDAGNNVSGRSSQTLQQLLHFGGLAAAANLKF